MTNKKIASSEGPLSAEAVQGAALSLESIDDIKGGDSLSLGVLSVGDCISDDTFEEGLEDTAGFFVDHCFANWRLAFFSILANACLMRKKKR